MCGIAGLFGPARMDADRLSGAVQAMAAAIAHRGPDDDGSWVDAEAGIGLGHRRLAVIDPTPAGAQPMVSASGRTVLVFNGCIYNFADLRRRLGSSFPWRGHCDTEVLLEAIEAWGPRLAAERSEGMFAFAVWDRSTRRLTLVRDRLGEKPLYWGVFDGRLAFASELGGLTTAPGFDAELDPEAVHSLLRWSFIPHPRSIYSGIAQLPPGSMLTATCGGSGIETHLATWWSIGEVAAAASPHRGTATDTADTADAGERLDSLLTESVSRRLVADVPTGAFLSGGIDSSLIAAIAQRHLGGERLRTFTVAMPDIGFDESASAEAVARHLGTEHTTLSLSTADALALVPRLVTIFSEPFADPSMLPSAALCAAVGKEVTVALSGDGGDESFAGYNRHVFGPRLARRANHVPRWARTALARAALAVPPGAVDSSIRTVGRLAKPLRGQRNIGDKLHKAAGVLAADDSSAWNVLAATWPASVVSAGSPTDTLAHLSDPLDSMLLADTAVVLPDDMLVKLDRASMAVGLEVRTPLLDYRIVEFAWSLPHDDLLDGRIGKLALRRMLDSYVPKDLTHRPKMGFDPPLGAWLRGPLRPWAEDLLSAQRLKHDGWIDASAVRTTWEQHLAGQHNWDYRLWAVLMLNSWLDARHVPMAR